MFTSILGTVVEMKQKSTRERLLRKKYMGVWRWESEPIARMMSRFPNKVIRYRDRKSPKRRSCRFGSSERPRRKNFETVVRFPVLCSLDIFGKQKDDWKNRKYIKFALKKNFLMDPAFSEAVHFVV